MVKQRSGTKYDYHAAYRLIRLYGAYCKIDRVGSSPYSVILKALISHDNRMDILSGWSKDYRRLKFINSMQDCKASRWSIPF